jgi:hypothetical protein
MAKERKVFSKYTLKYTSSSDDEVYYSDLFKGLDRAKIAKIIELINALNEKDRLLEKQEDLLYDEHDKVVNVEKSLALEIKKNELLSTELSGYHSFISYVKIANDDFNVKIEKLNKCHVSISSLEHVLICNRCKNIDVDACVANIANLNAKIAKVNVQVKISNDEL